MDSQSKKVTQKEIYLCWMNLGISKWAVSYSTLLNSLTYTSSWQFNTQFTEPNPFSQTSLPHFYKQGRSFQKKSLYNPQKVLDLEFSARHGREETGFFKVLTVTTERIQSPCTKPGCPFWQVSPRQSKRCSQNQRPPRVSPLHFIQISKAQNSTVS